MNASTDQLACKAIQYLNVYRPFRETDLKNLLEKFGYDDLSEDEKVIIFTHRPLANGRSVLDAFIEFSYFCKHRTKEELESVLQLIPLAAVRITQENIPAELGWIKSPQWMRDMMIADKSRWRGEVCDWSSQQASEDAAAQLCVVKQLAFTVLAAHLFTARNYKKSDASRLEVLMFLLDKAPQLVRIKVPYLKGVTQLPLYADLMGYCRPSQFQQNEAMGLTRALLDKGAIIGDADPAKILAAIYESRKDDGREYVCFITSLLSKGNEDRLKAYRDEKGNSLMHIFFANLTLFVTDDEMSCVIQLLELGFGLTDRNGDNQDSLSVIIKSYGCNIFISEERLRLLQFCVRTYIHGTKEQGSMEVVTKPNIQQPLHNTNEASLLFELIEIFQQLVDSDKTFDDILDAIITCVFENLSLPRVTTQDCTLCFPVARLMYSVVKKGLDVTSSELLSTIWPHYCFFPPRGSVIDYPCASACCQMNTLLLVLHWRADVSRVVHPPGAYTNVYNQLVLMDNSDFPQEEDILSLARCVWMYTTPGMIKPADLRDRRCVCARTQVSLSGETWAKLECLFHSVRPLRTLTRLALRRFVHPKNVKKLPLPRLMKEYIEIGDVAKDHPIRAVLQEEGRSSYSNGPQI